MDWESVNGEPVRLLFIWRRIFCDFKSNNFEYNTVCTNLINLKIQILI